MASQLLAVKICANTEGKWLRHSQPQSPQSEARREQLQTGFFCSIFVPFAERLEQNPRFGVFVAAGNSRHGRHVLYFQFRFGFPSWTSWVRVPSPAPVPRQSSPGYLPCAWSSFPEDWGFSECGSRRAGSIRRGEAHIRSVRDGTPRISRATRSRPQAGFGRDAGVRARNPAADRLFRSPKSAMSRPRGVPASNIRRGIWLRWNAPASPGMHSALSRELPDGVTRTFTASDPATAGKRTVRGIGEFPPGKSDHMPRQANEW